MRKGRVRQNGLPKVLLFLGTFDTLFMLLVGYLLVTTFGWSLNSLQEGLSSPIWPLYLLALVCFNGVANFISNFFYVLTSGVVYLR